MCTWLWGNKYGDSDVRKVAAGLQRHLSEPHRFIAISDRPIEGIETQPIPQQDWYLTNVKGCFARLRLFDPTFQALLQADDRIACIDLDSVVTGPLDVLFASKKEFLILKGANAVNPCPYNGSLWMLRKGYRPDVCSDFSLDAASKIKFFGFPDDQGWFAEKLPNAAGWKAGPDSGVYGFQKPGWPKGYDLPADARLVVFPGWRSPEKFKNLRWVQEHWRA